MALRGIRVIEMAGLAPVPFCGMILSDHGARVIRVDRPNSLEFDRASRGKESITVNLKTEGGRQIVTKLCQKADVLLEPYRPGIMEKLGLGPEKLLKANPALIYARLTGYGQTGSWSSKAGHDINYLALSGVLSKLGRRHENPYAPINLLADFAGGGLMCALGVMMALVNRAQTGKGQVIDANMVDGVAYLASWLDLTKDYVSPKARGYNMLDGGNAFYDTYKTKDDEYVAIGALEPQFYQDLLKGLGLDGSDVHQSDDQDKQRELFSKIFLTKTRDEWIKTFDGLDACVAPVLTTQEASELPHNKEKATYQLSHEGEIVGNPAPRLSLSKEIREPRPRPIIGQHTQKVLQDFGFSDSDINTYIKDGSVTPGSKL